MKENVSRCNLYSEQMITVAWHTEPCILMKHVLTLFWAHCSFVQLLSRPFGNIWPGRLLCIKWVCQMMHRTREKKNAEIHIPAWTLAIHLASKTFTNSQKYSCLRLFIFDKKYLHKEKNIIQSQKDITYQKPLRLIKESLEHQQFFSIESLKYIILC